MAAFEAGHDAFEGFFAQDRLAALTGILERNLGLAGTEQNQLLGLGVELIEGLVDVELIMRSKAEQNLKVELVTAIPAPDGAAREG